MKNLNRSFALAAALFLALLLPSALRADDKADAYKYGKEGIEAAKNKEWDKAIDLFQKAVKADPTVNNHNNLGRAYKGAGKLDEAIKTFTSAIEADENSTAGYVNRGLVYTAQKQYEQAIQDFTRSIKIDDTIPARRYRAFAYLQAKQYQKAVEDYDVVLKEKEDDAAILDRRAFAFWNMKEYDKAIADFTRIIQDKPQEKEAYLDRSYVYELKDEHEKGLADVEKVLSMDPKNEDALTRKARFEYHIKMAKATPTPTPRARPRRTLSEETPPPKKP